MFIFIYSTLGEISLKSVRKKTLDFSGIKSGNRALDVCCGTGAQCFYYSRMGVIATGIDKEIKMINNANRKKKKSKIENVFFQVADAQNLPFKDSFFDCASISFALHENESNTRDKIISEMKRVVKKDGTLIFIDFSVPLPKNYHSCLTKFIEWIIGSNNFRLFKNYIKEDGLDGLLKRNQLWEEKRDYLKNGNVLIIKARSYQPRNYREKIN